MSNTLTWCKQHYPIGSRWNIERGWWVDFQTGDYHRDRINGTVIKHWRATGNTPGLTLLCDDGREYGGEPTHLIPREAQNDCRGQLSLFSR
jgi:hypothetical protein